MGGAGSGWWHRSNAKGTVERCPSLDVNRWHREGRLRPGSPFRWAWSRAGEEQASIGVTALAGAVELSYTLEPGAERAEAVRYRVPLTWTACTYGGGRPWFRCPGVVDGRACGRRVAKLYLRGRYFLCRHCGGLAYQSQRDDRAHRALHRAQAIRLRLGGSASLLEPFPPRPVGMRRRMYERLRRRAEADEGAWVAALAAWLRR